MIVFVCLFTRNLKRKNCTQWVAQAGKACFDIWIISWVDHLKQEGEYFHPWKNYLVLLPGWGIDILPHVPLLWFLHIELHKTEVQHVNKHSSVCGDCHSAQCVWEATLFMYEYLIVVFFWRVICRWMNILQLVYPFSPLSFSVFSLCTKFIIQLFIVILVIELWRQTWTDF